MSTYIGTVRTNYFHVKNEEAFQNIMEKTYAEFDEIHLYSKTDDTGKRIFAFGSYGSILGFEDEEDSDKNHKKYDLDGFLSALQECVAEDDAVILYEVGYEKLSYVVGEAVVITSNQVEHINLENLAVEKAVKMLGNPYWTTENSY